MRTYTYSQWIYDFSFKNIMICKLHKKYPGPTYYDFLYLKAYCYVNFFWMCYMCICVCTSYIDFFFAPWKYVFFFKFHRCTSPSKGISGAPTGYLGKKDKIHPSKRIFPASSTKSFFLRSGSLIPVHSHVRWICINPRGVDTWTKKLRIMCSLNLRASYSYKLHHH